VSRFSAVFAFYGRALPGSIARLATFLDRAAQASRVGAMFDDAATGQGLVTFFLHGCACGAIDDAELAAAGLDVDAMSSRSFVEMAAARARR
jgi:hypothetical protein